MRSFLSPSRCRVGSISTSIATCIPPSAHEVRAIRFLASSKRLIWLLRFSTRTSGPGMALAQGRGHALPREASPGSFEAMGAWREDADVCGKPCGSHCTGSDGSPRRDIALNPAASCAGDGARKACYTFSSRCRSSCPGARYNGTCDICTDEYGNYERLASYERLPTYAVRARLGSSSTCRRLLEPLAQRQV